MAKSNSKAAFKTGQYVVYPAHGVGRIESLESQEVGGIKLEVFVIFFEKDKMTLRVPVNRAEKAGLRSLSNGGDLTKAFSTLQGKVKIARGMWSRRAQEYETKINSGDIVSIAEVVRDLHKNIDQPDRSYSERMIYESALTRLTNEVAAAENIDQIAATQRVLTMLKQREKEKEAA
jgi:CarD family transcriptional regulator